MNLESFFMGQKAESMDAQTTNSMKFFATQGL